MRFVIVLIILGALACFIWLAVNRWNNRGELTATKGDVYDSADRYADIEAVGRDDAELARASDPEASIEDIVNVNDRFTGAWLDNQRRKGQGLPPK